MWVFANDVLKIKKLDIKEILNTLSPHKYKHLFQQTQDKKKNKEPESCKSSSGIV